MGVAPSAYPLRFARADDGSAHVEPLDDGAWRYAVTERGAVVQDHLYPDDEALLYRLVCDVAKQEGSLWQAHNPDATRDPRRVDFARRLELVGRVSPVWRIKLAEELAQWLTRHPYADRGEHVLPDVPASKGWGGLAVVAALVAAWAAAHYPLWSVWHEQRRLETDGFGVTAEVIERHRTDGKFADEYHLTYRYQGASRTMVGSDSVDWQTYRRAEPEGATLEVLYDPANQDISMIAGNDRAGRLAWIYAAIDALIVLIMARGWRNLRREAKAG